MADVTKDRARQHRLADALRERRRAERTERDAKEEARERRWRNSGKAFVKVAPFFTTTAGQVEIVGPKGTATVRSGVVELINYADHQYDYRITVVVELVDGEPTITRVMGSRRCLRP